MQIPSAIIQPAPLTYIGWNSINQLQQAVQGFEKGKVLVIADPTLVKLNITKTITSILESIDVSFDVYSDLTAEPTLEIGQKIIDYSRQTDYKVVVGFGGGSALDLAKLAAVFYSNPGDLREYLNLSGTKKIEHKGLPKILIPTTSGTGTEVTNISVLALEKTKDVIVHDYLIADIAIVDPAFTVSVPPAVTAATGADALTHAIEAYISVNANPYSDGLALQAIALISSSLKAAVLDGSNKEARSQLAYGSYIAGMAFFNAGVGAVHALAYPLGGQFHLAHGDSNAVLLPYVLKYIHRSCQRKLTRILQAIEGFVPEISEEQATEKCIELLAQLMADIGIPVNLNDFGIPYNAAQELAIDATQQKRLLARCPARLQEKDILAIYQSAFKKEAR